MVERRGNLHDGLQELCFILTLFSFMIKGKPGEPGAAGQPGHPGMPGSLGQKVSH